MDKKLSFSITGATPLLMHSDQGLDPLHPLVRERKGVTGKRAKTDEDHAEIARLDFILAMYHDPAIGPYIPGVMVEAAIRDAAKAQKLGKEVTRSLLVEEDKIPLDYAGPRSIDKLWADINFRDTRSAVVQRARVLRTRPRFNQWSANFTVSVDTEHLDADKVEALVELAGRRVGIGDFRPRFGRFDVDAA